jgi:hypothetical protein
MLLAAVFLLHQSFSCTASSESFPLSPSKQPRADEGSSARSFASLLLKTKPEDVNFRRFRSSRLVSASKVSFFVHAAEVAITLRGERNAPPCAPDKLLERKEEATN